MSETAVNESAEQSETSQARDLPQSWLKQAENLLDQPRVMNFTLVVVLLCAALFRFYDRNWDEGHHLHPDERFLSTVTNDLQWPRSFELYFDPNTSTLSPYALPNMGLYVYGTLPVYVVKWTAILLDDNNYDNITQVGRAISALFDIGAIFLLFLIGSRLYGKKVGLLAAGLMSLSVLNIQLSHFYTVDTFANLFIIATIYFVLRANETGRWLDHVLAGLMFGLGLASKLSVFTLAVPILIGAGLDFYQRTRGGNLRGAIEHTFVRLITLFFVALLTFRVIQPIAFSGPGFWDWSLNPRWLQDIREQQKILSGAGDLPWVQQWTNRSVLFPLYNMIVWGLGIPLGLAGAAGFALATYELIRHRKLEHLLPLAYVSITFIYHAITFIKFMRYFLPLYPFLVLFAAYFIRWLLRYANGSEEVRGDETEATESNRLTRLLARLRPSRRLTLVFSGLILAGTLLYALAFSAIYSQEHTRIKASRWMYQNIPAGSTLANEHWDDWLPIGGLDGRTSYGDAGTFQSVEMRNYEDDTPEKLNQMVENLTRADYIVLSSNRLYDSIPRLPMRYPLTTRYYELLFNGKLGFERVAEFTSYPRIFGIQFPDQSAEESFSVYDHPRVQIFKKTDAFNPTNAILELSEGIAWNSVIHLTPRQSTAAPSALQLTAEERDRYEETAIWSSAEIRPDSWGNKHPTLAWVVILEFIGLLSLPLNLLVFKNLADRGYIFSKAAGLLLIAWAAWMIASLRLAPFTFWTIIAMMAALALASSLLISRQKWNELLSFMKANWQLLLIEELLFWIFFAGFLFIRLRNPDLWHPGLGGEKPMDLAYLTAIVRTPYFPSYDPWFAGGYINYYYFGFVLIATLIHLSGEMPYIAYNLAVPTLFAMTAMGAFTVALNFAVKQKASEEEPRPFLGVGRTALLVGLCGALFVAVIGNLGQVQLLWNGVRSLSPIQAESNPSWQVAVAQFSDGLNQMLGGQKLNLRTDWWYWNATRVIPPGEGEAGPINELPFFTFLFGDLHAHMMALPYTLLVLGLAVNLVRESIRVRANEDSRFPQFDSSHLLTLAFLALTTGALWTINTWDFPTYTALTIAALCCLEYARRRKVDIAGLWSVAWRAGVILVAGRLLFMPFHQNYASEYFGAELWKGSQTPLKAFLIIHGFFLFSLISYLILEILTGHGHNALIRSLRLNLKYWRRRTRQQRLFKRLAHPAPSFGLGMDFGKIALVLVIIVILLKPVIGLVLGLVFMTAILLFSPRPDPIRQFLLCMIGLVLMFTAFVEIFVLKGDISRMNTVFKFYLQVWVIWAVASASVLPQLASRLRTGTAVRSQARPVMPELPEGSPWTPEIQAEVEGARRGSPSGTGALARGWWSVFGILLAACLLYPITATPKRIGDRFENSVASTLDGSAYMRTSIYYDDGRPVTLDWDRQAMEWLRKNVKGIPTILEANTPLYRWGSRVSIYTGLPTVIGWDWHQKQQRSILPGQIIEKRIEDVRTIYTTTDLDQAMQLLHQYDVRYIYVGPLEQIYYGGDGLNKFNQSSDNWSLVYQNEQVKIYQTR